MKVKLKEWSLLGAALIQLNSAQFETLLDAMRRIVAREEVLTGSYRSTETDTEVVALTDRFSN